MSWILSILSALSGVWGFATKLVEFAKDKSLILIGRLLEQGDLAKKDAEATRTAAEIMAKEVTKEETAKKLEDGTF